MMPRFGCGLVACLMIATLSPVTFPLIAVPSQVSVADNSLIQAHQLFAEGMKLIKQNQFQGAIVQLEAARAIYRETGDSIPEAFCLFYIGLSKFNLSEFDSALQSLEGSLTIWQQTLHSTLQGETLTLMGFAWEKKGNFPQAVAAYKQAVDSTENILKGLKIEEDQLPFSNLQAMAYEHLSILAFLSNRYEEGFNYVERSKARAFLNQFVPGSINFGKNADADLLARGEAIARDMAAARNRLLDAKKERVSDEKIQELDTQYQAFEKQYNEWYLELRQRSPETASLKRVEVASLSEIQKAVAQIDPDTTLVEYFIAQERVFAFVITHNSFKMLLLPVKKKDLEKGLNEWWKYDLQQQANVHPPSLKDLYDWLIAPIKPHITTANIGIIPHGMLHSVPFPGLTDGKHYLIDDYAVFLLPNASILKYLPKKRKPSNGKILALAMGDPNLSTPPTDSKLSVLLGVIDEVKALKDIFPNTQVFVEQAATESLLFQQGGEHEILHIAAHGVYRGLNEGEAPLSSAIYLAKDARNDGSLQGWDLYKLDLSKATNLVVLTACEVQKAIANPSDELTSLTRGFMYAGTPSILSTIWRANDTSTQLLMKYFYTNLLQAKMSKAQAIRQAQIQLRKDYPNEYAHPYSWSGFMLTGDWGNL
ncbi:MAG: CHAT domain-containing protein [Actinomycetota bacterium]